MVLTLPTSRPARRALLGAVPLLAGALILTGCGRTSEASDAAASATVDDAPATGTVDIWVGAPDGDALEDFLQPFVEENPDVTLNIRSIPSDEYDTTLTAAIASGNVPDVAMMYSQTEPSMIATDAFAAVPDGLVDPDAFFETAWDLGVVDGVSYAVPWYSYANVLYYRADLFEQNGIEPPTTWDAFVSASAQLKDAGVEYPIATDVDWNNYTAQAFNDFAGQGGGSLISDDLTEWTIDTPENLETLEFYASLFTDDLASADGPVFLDRAPNMVAGTNAMSINGPWFPGFLDQVGGDGWAAEHIGAIVPPAGPAGVATSFGGGSFGVLRDADNADSGWKLLRYLSEPEVQVDWYTTFGNLPAVSAGWDEEPIASDPLLAAVKEALPDSSTVPPVPTFTQVGDMIGQQLETVARGQATPAEALATMQAQADAIGTGVE